jgi:ADP-ribose pyrophosphatase
VVSYSTEFIDIWFARGLTLQQAKLDEGEFLEVIAVTLDELLEWCRSGRVTDAKTMIGAFWLQNVLSAGWVLDWKPIINP